MTTQCYITTEPKGAELQAPVNQAITETNSVLAGCNVHYLFRGSRVNLETGRNGIRWLIAEILLAAQMGKAYVEYSGNLRKGYLAFSLTTEQICERVRAINGFDKYTNHTIEQYLSRYMVKDKQVGKIQMTNEEDFDRTCNRPRCKWYLMGS